jgi:hypothetical protein
MEITGSTLMPLGITKLPQIVCSNCHTKGTTEMTVSVNHLKVLFIPAFSIGKVGSTDCTKCQFETVQEDFSEELEAEYKKIKSTYKIPLAHYSLSIVLALLIGISFLFSVTGNSTVDPREAMYENDLKALGTQKQQPGDTLAGKFLAYMQAKADPMTDPKGMSCLTKQNGNKVLFFVTIPSYKLLQEDRRQELLDLITDFVTKENSLQGKELYLSVYGLMDLVKYYKTPKEEGTEGGYLTSLALYEFYGSAPVSK